MLIPFLVFWILLGWSLYDGDLYPQEAAILVAIWAGLLVVFLIFKVPLIWFVVPTVVLDIVLIVKIFGQDVQIR